ncbi:hypothetical protein PV516_19470 [Streptomyces scabiei]|uniref:hypothetical protein n=1 Tax=Streptomyces scabiei TaxID=1930 RepID=UPI0029B693B0|nr:hypothetical protein [Streptomyces scabiei]MDX3165970.1 hypothetical protein [Streptomyces scabiei]
MGSVEPFTTPAGDTSAPKPDTSVPSAKAVHSRFELVRGSAQDVVHTASRRCEPRDWLVALDWLIFEAKLHPKATLTTMRVAMDLAGRMDYRRGIVLYDLLGTAATLKVHKATVKRHVAYLRELGALVWLEHGTKRNLHLPGRKYTATATIYGATIPAVYDAAKGHRLRGSGYEATIIGFTEAGREQAVAKAKAKAAKRLAPPSRGGSAHVTADVDGGKDKATRGARPSKSKPPKKSTLGHKVTAALFQAADRLARRLRPLHNWTQRAKISELSWVLVDKLAEGCTEQQVDAWLRDISPSVVVGLDWRPNRPHAYIASLLVRDLAVRQGDAQLREDWANTVAPNADFAAAVQETRDRQRGGEVQPDCSGLEDLDEETRKQMRAEAWSAYKYTGDPGLVLTTYELAGPQVAVALYGQELVDLCQKLRANANNPRIRLH